MVIGESDDVEGCRHADRMSVATARPGAATLGEQPMFADVQTLIAAYVVMRFYSASVGWTMTHNILLIQGNAQSAHTICKALTTLPAGQFHIEWVKTCALGLSRLMRCREPRADTAIGISAILTDLSLPDIAGVEIVDQLLAAMPRVPVVIVASETDGEMAEVAVRRGARDYFPTNRIDSYCFPKAIVSVISHAAASVTLFDEKEQAQLMLDSIGDAVISTTLGGDVTYLNVAAERLTGWPRADAIGRRFQDVFRIIDADSRLRIPVPMIRALHDHQAVALPPSCILIARDGSEAAIEDSCAPVHNRLGQVTGTVMVFHDVAAARTVTSNPAHLARHDSLTDLPNRACLNDRLAQAIIMAKRHQKAFALLYFDLDHFKQINDSLGHLVGDRLLQSVALRLSQCVRASDTVSRQGGDEFVILMPDMIQSQDAVTCAQKVIQAITLPYIVDEHELFVTASVGIVLYPDDGMDVETLLENADSAMYAAKERGRNNYQFYRSDVNAKAIERQSLETGLRLAIKRHEFELHYQSMVNLATGAIAGAEALLRWRHPTLGLMPPTAFMTIAEESGLMIPIGQWVLREGCRQAKMWQSEFAQPLRLAMNISAMELRSNDFLSTFKRILKETGFNPNSLSLELTETFLMQDSKSTALVLQALKALGVHLALDDFGTGYSSLSFMRRFPIDALKIDRSFISNIDSNAEDAGVVSAIINMGKNLHMRVVGKGVETEQQMQFLQLHDCSEAQGHWFSRPLSAADFRDLLCCAARVGGASLSLPNAHRKPDALGDVPEPGEATAQQVHHRLRPGDHYPVPVNERGRLEELYRYKILDTPPEELFDRLTQLAAHTCEVPIALISLVDRDRQWFKSQHGLAASQTSREQAFCAHTILGSDPLVVENATVDPRFADNLLVRHEPGIRFYAGIPLITSRGFALGSLCVIDRRPRRLTAEKLSTLRILASQVVQQIELREIAETLRTRSMLLDKVQQTARIGGWEIDLRTNLLTWTHETYRIHGLTPSHYTPTVESAIQFYAPDAMPVIRRALGDAITAAVKFDAELKIVRHDGEQKWVRVIGAREDEAGEPRRVVGVFQDIDEVRKLESEIIDIAQYEQTRIGLDLHDGLGQELTGIAFMVGSLLSEVPADADGLRVQITEVEKQLRGAIGTCRSVARGLSPTGRDRRGLIGAIRDLAARLEKVHGITISTQSKGRAWMLAETVADHLFRIVQESISNAIKHGPAERIAVSVDWNVERTLITVTNDGKHVHEVMPNGGLGLHIMRYRARLVGATLAISRTGAGGARIRCNLPKPSLTCPA